MSTIFVLLLEELSKQYLYVLYSKRTETILVDILSALKNGDSSYERFMPEPSIQYISCGVYIALMFSTTIFTYPIPYS